MKNLLFLLTLSLCSISNATEWQFKCASKSVEVNGVASTETIDLEVKQVKQDGQILKACAETTTVDYRDVNLSMSIGDCTYDGWLMSLKAVNDSPLMSELKASDEYLKQVSYGFVKFIDGDKISRESLVCNFYK